MPGNDEGRPPPGAPAHIEALRPTEPPASSDSTTDSRQNINYDWEAAWNKPAAPTIPDDMSQVDAAHALAKAGIYVFPVDHPELPRCAGIGKNHDPGICDQRGKHPAVQFTVAADTNPKMIDMWWAGPPRNIGVNCGKSGLVVVDEDQLGAFERYADEHQVKIPPTMVVATAKGRHYYFTAREDHPLGNEEGAFRDYSINIRAGNGYVVGPGSIHATGVVYRIEVALPPAPLPDWVIAAIQTKPRPEPSKAETNGAASPRGLDAVPDVIRGPRTDGGGNRHGALVSYASRLRALSLTRTEAEPLFRKVWERCEQPPDCTTPLPWDDALTKLDDVYSRYAEGKSANYREVSAEEIHATNGSAELARRIRLTPASAIKPRPVRWAWEDRIPAGELTLTPGRGGVGKSTFHAWVIAHLTRGTLPGVHFGTPKTCIIAASEDSWERTIVPRLIAASADMDLVYRVDVATETDEVVSISLPRDVDGLTEEITRIGAAALSVDPVMSVLSNALDTHKDREVRRGLEPLGRLADRTGCVVLGNAHFNKSSGSDPLSLIMGSAAFGNVARAALGFARDTEDEDGSCVISQAKNNLGRLDLPSLRYRIEQAIVDTEEGPAEVGKLVMMGESDRSVAEILRDSRRDSGDPEERRDAASWIKDYLTQAGGEALVKDVIAAGKAVGYAEQTLKNVRRKVADTDQSGFGKDQVHKWILRRDTARVTGDTGLSLPVSQVSQAVPLQGDSVNASDSSDASIGNCSVCDQPLTQPNKACPARQYHGEAAA